MHTVTSAPPRPAGLNLSGSSLALSNLRAVVILIVLAFHSMLAYLDWLPKEMAAFTEPPYRWQAFPMLDQQRWFGFDLFCAWQDVCLMSLMFFLSGLFVWPSIRRKESGKFLADRIMRLGVPAVLIVAILMPLAYYPSYAVVAPRPSVADYWQQLRSLPFWPCGPLWFVWQLLLLNVIVAALHKLYPTWGESLARIAAGSRQRPVRFCAWLTLASAVVYVPMAFAFTPWEWHSIGPIGFQYCRPLHYLVFFFAGVAIGAHGLEQGLLARDGALARHWARWVVAGLLAFGLWGGLTGPTLDNDQTPFWLNFGAFFSFSLACATGCLALMAVFVRFAHVRSRVLDSLSENAYGMYLVHYPFVIWLQYALLPASLSAAGKVAVVFAVSVIASWAATVLLANAPVGAYLVGARR